MLVLLIIELSFHIMYSDNFNERSIRRFECEERVVRLKIVIYTRANNGSRSNEQRTLLLYWKIRKIMSWGNQKKKKRERENYFYELFLSKGIA